MKLHGWACKRIAGREQRMENWCGGTWGSGGLVFLFFLHFSACVVCEQWWRRGGGGGGGGGVLEMVVVESNKR